MRTCRFLLCLCAQSHNVVNRAQPEWQRGWKLKSTSAYLIFFPVTWIYNPLVSVVPRFLLCVWCECMSDVRSVVIAFPLSLLIFLLIWECWFSLSPSLSFSFHLHFVTHFFVLTKCIHLRFDILHFHSEKKTGFIFTRERKKRIHTMQVFRFIRFHGIFLSK